MTQQNVTLTCTSGMIQHGATIHAIMESYNGSSKTYEVRVDDEGRQILWHKGHNYKIGVFSQSKFIDTDEKIDTCHDCGSPMTPHECIGNLLPGEVVDGEVWVRCTGCGGRGGVRFVGDQVSQ